MFRWIEVATENNKARYETLSQFLNENGFPNQVDFLEINISELEAVLDELKNKYQGIRIGRGLGEVVVPLFVGHPLLVRQIRAADSLVCEHGVWGLRANAVEGLTRVLSRAGERFALDSAVLIVGSGAAAQVAVAALFRLGFKQFAISTLDLSKAEQMIAHLQKSLFGGEFRIVAKDKLVLLPGIHGVLVNTTPLSADNPLLAELNYFNFFKQGGVAIDFTIQPIETPLLTGARDVGAYCIRGYQISAQTDMLWAEQITGRKLDGSQYEERLKKSLTESSAKS